MAFRYTPTPTPSVSPTISLTPSNTPSYTPTGTVCPGATPTMTPSVSLSPTITPTNTATPTGTIQATPTTTSTPTPTRSITYDLYEADRFTCLYPGCALDASGVIVALPAGTIPDYGKFYSSLVPDGFSYELIGLGSGGPGWILSTLNYTSCADACAPA